VTDAILAGGVVFAVGTSEFLLGPVGTTPGQSDVETFAAADCKRPDDPLPELEQEQRLLREAFGPPGGYRETLQVVGQQLALPPVASTPPTVDIQALPWKREE